MTHRKLVSMLNTGQIRVNVPAQETAVSTVNKRVKFDTEPTLISKQLLLLTLAMFIKVHT